MPTIVAGNAARAAYHDRNPTTQQDSYVATGVAPHASTDRVTFTVGAGRKAFLEHFLTEAMRLTVAAPVGDAFARFQYTPNGQAAKYAAESRLVGNVVEDRNQKEASSYGYLGAADVLTGTTADASTGGTVDYQLTYKATLFDA